jgi:hypothetical protein
MDLQHMGVGGDDSWTHLRTVAEAHYVQPEQTSTFSLRLLPLGLDAARCGVYPEASPNPNPNHNPRPNPNPGLDSSPSPSPSSPSPSPSPSPDPNPNPNQASLAHTARPILLSGSPLLLRAVSPPTAAASASAASASASAASATAPFGDPFNEVDGGGGGGGGGDGGGDGSCCGGGGGDVHGGAYLRVAPLEHPAVSVQPLPSRLPRTQRHLGALTVELMYGEGGPVCFGNTVTLRGRGGRYVDANPNLSPSLDPDPDPDPNTNSNFNPNPRPNPKPNPKLNPNPNPNPYPTPPLTLTLTLTPTRYVDVDVDGGAVAARWSAAGAWQVPSTAPSFYCHTPCIAH